MHNAHTCKDCDKARKRTPVHPSRSADAEIRRLVVPSPTTSPAAAAVAVERAKESARGANPAAVLAALKLLRPQSTSSLGWATISSTFTAPRSRPFT